MGEYWKLFPELAGRFAFVGDDGQGDLLVAEMLLRLKDEDGTLLLAFCAIRAVHPYRKSDEPLVPAKTREDLVRRVRAELGRVKGLGSSISLTIKTLPSNFTQRAGLCKASARP